MRGWRERETEVERMERTGERLREWREREREVKRMKRTGERG